MSTAFMQLQTVQTTTLAPGRHVIFNKCEADDPATDTDGLCQSRAIINFRNGQIDPSNPHTYPVLLDVHPLQTMLEPVAALMQNFSEDGISNYLGIDDTTLLTSLMPELSSIQAAAAELTESILTLDTALANSGIVPMDVFIGHANMGLLPKLSAAEVPVLKPSAGPPHPQLISRNGIITSFAAEFDCSMSVDPVMMGSILGLTDDWNTTAFNHIDKMISEINGDLFAIEAKVAASALDSPDELKVLLRSQQLPYFPSNLPEGSYHIHAVLWRGTPNECCGLGGNIRWEKAIALDLGSIYWYLLPTGSFYAGIPESKETGDPALDIILSSLKLREMVSATALNLPFVRSQIKDLNIAVSALDYLMVQFTLVGNNNALIAGVIAPNAMASVTIA